jgi:hypothetical protein
LTNTVLFTSLGFLFGVGVAIPVFKMAMYSLVVLAGDFL